jgi:hypothetical protein
VPHQAESFEGQERFDGIDFREAGRNKFSITAGRYDGEMRAPKFLPKFAHEFANQTPIAMDGAH